MLRILPKYILREHIGPFFLAFSVINALFLLNLVVRDLGKFLSKGIPFPIILEFLFLNLAWMIALSVPMSVLCASIMALGRLSADNEITAIKASGVSFMQILPSLLLTSGLICYGLIWFNNNVLPDFNHRTRLLSNDIRNKRPTIDLEPGVLYTEIPNYAILVQSIEEKDSVAFLKNIILDDQTESNVLKTISAKSGEMRMNSAASHLRMTLLEGEMHEVNLNKAEAYKKLIFTKLILKINVTGMVLNRSESGSRGDREKSAAQLMETVEVNRKGIRQREKKIDELLAKLTVKYLTDSVAANIQLSKALQEHQQLKRQIVAENQMITSYNKQVNKYMVEVHKKYSIPVACIIFVMIGAPLGILARRSGWVIAAALSIGFFILYWLFLIGGEILADRRLISAVLAMWGPNIVVGIGGVYLIFRAVKERTLFSYLRR